MKRPSSSRSTCVLCMFLCRHGRVGSCVASCLQTCVAPTLKQARACTRFVRQVDLGLCEMQTERHMKKCTPTYLTKDELEANDSGLADVSVCCRSVCNVPPPARASQRSRAPVLCEHPCAHAYASLMSICRGVAVHRCCMSGWGRAMQLRGKRRHHTPRLRS